MPARTAQERAQREARRRAREYTARQQVHAEQRRRRRRDNIAAVVGLVVVAALATLIQIGYYTLGPGAPVPKRSTAASASATPTPAPTPSASATVPPKSLADDRTWTGSMTLNSVKLGITLDGKHAPQAVANFVSLTRKGFYKGLTCHRETTGSSRILQCGDPNGNGSGGPGYSFGPIENAPKNDSYATGVLAMARTSDDASSQGSQFFIVYGTSTFPSDSAGGYTVFGHVTSGIPALKTGIVAKGIQGGSTDGKPKIPVTITALSVR